MEVPDEPFLRVGQCTACCEAEVGDCVCRGVVGFGEDGDCVEG